MQGQAATMLTHPPGHHGDETTWTPTFTSIHTTYMLSVITTVNTYKAAIIQVCYVTQDFPLDELGGEDCRY